MALIYPPLTINRALTASLRDIQTSMVQDEDARLALGTLLQSALGTRVRDDPYISFGSFQSELEQADSMS